MSTPEYIVKQEHTRKRSLSNEDLPTEINKKERNSALSLFDLCDATARITKKLLALGAENNWEDVKYSQGRSRETGKYRDNWLYLSRTDHSALTEPEKQKKPDWYDQFSDGVSQTFFYYPPKIEWKQHKSQVERNAAVSVLSLSGSCDQHAFVLATLLRAILPVGTKINICGLKMGGKPFPHTFVVIGSLTAKTSTPLNNLPINSLLVVDAWPTIGGAVPLRDFFVCDGAINDAVLVVDKSYIADGKDYLIKRVSKQKILHDIIQNEDPDIVVEAGSGLTSFLHHDLLEQINYAQTIKRDKYLSKFPDDYEGMFAAPTISVKYQSSMRLLDALAYICQNYPHKQFNRCLEYVEQKVKELVNADENSQGDFKQRLNSGF